MTWRDWALIVLCLILVGVVVWVARDNVRLKERHADLVELTRQAKDRANQEHRNVLAALKEADALRDKNAELEAALEASKAAVSNLPKNPADLPDCMVSIVTLQRRVSLLEQSLALSKAEVLKLREAVEAYGHETVALRKVIDYDTERFRLEYKMQRRRRLRTGLIVTGTVLAAGAMGWAIGRAQ